METQTKQVAFTTANIGKCQCTNCGVQSGSSCVTGKMQAMQGAATQSTPAPEDVPKVYCSQGTASCGDLDFSQNCICPTCSVWKENDLSNYKYCQHGSAAVQG
jgi:hypothetical protein